MMRTWVWLVVVFTFCGSSGLLTAAAQTTGPLNATALEGAKKRQKELYDECEQSYTYWCGEVKRISAKNYPHEQYRLENARKKANELSERARLIASNEYLMDLYREQFRLVKAADDNRQERLDNLMKARAQAEAERREQVEEARQRRLDEQRTAQEARERAIRLARERAAQQELDKLTWGIITREKYDRIQTGMDMDEVTSILGPTTALKTTTNDKTGTVTNAEWTSEKRDYEVKATFRGERLYEKSLRTLEGAEPGAGEEVRQ